MGHIIKGLWAQLLVITESFRYMNACVECKQKTIMY